MAKPTYWELLKHPLWQRKRLQVMERAGFKCQSCGTGEVTLHVHHQYYERGKNPWDYPDASLRCLCENCHEDAQLNMTLTHRALGIMDPYWSEQLYGYINGLNATVDLTLLIQVASMDMARGIADAWGLTALDVFNAAKGKVRRISGTKLEEMRLAVYLARQEKK